MTGSHIEHDAPHAPHIEAHEAVHGTESHSAASLDAEHEGSSNTVMATVATVGAVGVAAVVLEAALIPGIVIGVAAALAPTFVPRLGSALNPLFRSGVRGAYKFGQKTREMMHEAREQISDIAAEVEATGQTTATGSKTHNGAA